MDTLLRVHAVSDDFTPTEAALYGTWYLPTGWTVQSITSRYQQWYQWSKGRLQVTVGRIDVLVTGAAASVGDVDGRVPYDHLNTSGEYLVRLTTGTVLASGTTPVGTDVEVALEADAGAATVDVVIRADGSEISRTTTSLAYLDRAATASVVVDKAYDGWSDGVEATLVDGGGATAVGWSRAETVTGQAPSLTVDGLRVTDWELVGSDLDGYSKRDWASQFVRTFNGLALPKSDDYAWPAAGWLSRATINLAWPLAERGRVVTQLNGRQAVYRDGQVWLRSGEHAAWQSVFTPSAGERLTLALARADRLVVTDGTLAWFADFGIDWASGGLPSNLATITGALGAPLADLLLDADDGVPLAAWLDGDSLRAASTADTAQVVGAASDLAADQVWLQRARSGRPLLFLGRANGRWLATGATADREWTEYVAASLPTWRSTGFADARNGTQVLVGCNDGVVEVCWRESLVLAWSEPLTVVDLGQVVAPYVCALRTGRWEVGWLDAAGAWTRYRANHPTAAWSLA